MTEFIDRASDNYTVDHDIDTRDKDQIGCSESSDSEDSDPKSDSSESGSWSIDESIEFMQVAHKPMFNELPTFSVMSASAGGRSLSPSSNEPISLFNLSISPISSIEDLSNDANNFLPHGSRLTKDLTQSSTATGYDEEERISLEEITAQINTPPILSKSNKRLNLETIFEDVFLETPKKRRFNEMSRFNSWRIETYQEITSEERISSYVFEQQQNRIDQEERPESTSTLCNAFDDKINLNT